MNISQQIAFIERRLEWEKNDAYSGGQVKEYEAILASLRSIDDAWIHLKTALAQTIDTDDQIIIGHLRAAERLLRGEELVGVRVPSKIDCEKATLAQARAGTSGFVGVPVWSIEWRPEICRWEVMRGSAHHGLYESEQDACKALAAAGGSR